MLAKVEVPGALHVSNFSTVFLEQLLRVIETELFFAAFPGNGLLTNVETDPFSKETCLFASRGVPLTSGFKLMFAGHVSTEASSKSFKIGTLVVNHVVEIPIYVHGDKSSNMRTALSVVPAWMARSVKDESKASVFLSYEKVKVTLPDPLRSYVGDAPASMDVSVPVLTPRDHVLGKADVEITYYVQPKQSVKRKAKKLSSGADAAEGFGAVYGNAALLTSKPVAPGAHAQRGNTGASSAKSNVAHLLK